MSRGFYAATAAMMTNMEHFETVANNLANINTHGYKRHQALHHDFQEGFLERVQSARLKLQTDAQGELKREQVTDSPQPIGELGTGTYLSGTWTDFQEGSLEETQNSLDLALKGDGFFVIQRTEGEAPRYTRNGHFQLNQEGQLVTSDGYAVLGQSGPITLEARDKISIDENGRIFRNNQEIDQIQLVNFKQPQLLSNEGANSFVQVTQMESAEPTATVAQGFLEQSNVDVAGEMVQMISALRSYQIAQKALQSEDDMSGKLINQVGRA